MMRRNRNGSFEYLGTTPEEHMFFRPCHGITIEAIISIAIYFEHHGSGCGFGSRVYPKALSGRSMLLWPDLCEATTAPEIGGHDA